MAEETAKSLTNDAALAHDRQLYALKAAFPKMSMMDCKVALKNSATFQEALDWLKLKSHSVI